jgi:mRNA interferase MazF
MGLIAGNVYILENKEADGSVVKKKRPMVIISPDILNDYNHTVMVVPLTSTVSTKPWRVRIKFQGKDGMAMCEQVMTFDKDHPSFNSLAGQLSKIEMDKIKEVLRRIFQ